MLALALGALTAAFTSPPLNVRAPAARRAPATTIVTAAVESPVQAIFEQVRGGSVLSGEAKSLLKGAEQCVGRVNALEADMEALSDAGLRDLAKTLGDELSALDQSREASDAQVASAFALAREAAWRVLKLRAYDVQLLGGYVMSRGALAEMATGEGKTLAAVAPTLLGALRRRGALVVTANDYLARRDADGVGLVLRFLGLSVGLVESSMAVGGDDRRDAYASDVTYVSNAELGFDYLRDQLALEEAELVMPSRPGASAVEELFYWCLVDEADSILIDEARTPLIISETTAAPKAKYDVARDLADGVLQKGRHYDVDEKGMSVILTEAGYGECERTLGTSMFDPKDPWAPFVLGALRAKELLLRDRDYLVDGAGAVKLVDAFSGRVLEGRRYADGLQQSIEAKEGLVCSDQTRPTAQVTFQALFRTLSSRLAGMTGTALSDGKELGDVYKLTVVPIPTALPIARKDYDDAVYRTVDAKERAAAAEVVRAHKDGRPVLVGTTSVEQSDAFVERLLRDYGLAASKLSARPDAAARESAVIAQAGRLGAVTVATNMAGRGTDIKLGGSASDLAKLVAESRLLDEDYAALLEVGARRLGHRDRRDAIAAPRRGAAADAVGGAANLDRDAALQLLALAAEGRAIAAAVVRAGGLYVVGTERHESVRIDNQLRGRSGRQGDAGASRFFVSVDDPMFKTFGGDQIAKLMETFRVGDDLPLEAKSVTENLGKIQAKVEAYNADLRVNVLKFDDVLDGQRRALYATRRRLLLDGADDAAANAREWAADALLAIAKSVDRDAGADGDADALLAARLDAFFGPGALRLDADALAVLGEGEATKVAALPAVAACVDGLLDAVAEKRPAGPPTESFTKLALIRLDKLWADHLLNMNYLKESVQLRTLQQTDPFQEYQREGFELLTALQTKIKADTIDSLLQIAME
ncbi:ATPase-coupled protein transmembrane transporter [Aureococcus anophagefferens]|nr:ATPase-coupled protein transmembrane transporter [Aureococcus anophagefferens]